MKSAGCPRVLVLLAIMGLANPAGAGMPTLAYTASGVCLNSPDGFNSKLEPINSGVTWTVTFNAVGSVDADGNVAEVGQSVDTASFGVGPRMHAPAANVYKDTFTSTVTGPNDDGSSTFQVKMLSGTFTAGPNVGLSFKVSAFELKGWIGNSGTSAYGNTGSPVIQTFSMSNGTSFKRICALSVSTSRLQ